MPNNKQCSKKFVENKNAIHVGLMKTSTRRGIPSPVARFHFENPLGIAAAKPAITQEFNLT